MLVYDPDATPLDLRFRIFGVHVRVHPVFWLIMLIFGWPRGGGVLANGLGDALIFVACAFVSILLHELGHVWMGQVFGSRGHILLHGMGGLAIGSADVPHSGQRILVSAAGPGIQLVLYAALYWALYLGVFNPLLAREIGEVPAVWQLILETFLRQLMWINLFWPILNLLPIWPLDGGWIVREICQSASARRGLLTSLWISLVAAVLFAINALMVQVQKMPVITIGLGWLVSTIGNVVWLPEWVRLTPALLGFAFSGMFMAFFFAMFAFGSWQAIQAENQRQRRFWDDSLPWER